MARVAVGGGWWSREAFALTDEPWLLRVLLESVVADNVASGGRREALRSVPEGAGLFVDR